MEENRKIISQNKIIIYTANYGNYDILKNQLKFPNVEYICFTDNPKIKSETWNIIYDKSIMKYHTPRIKSKYFKIMSHLLSFNENDILIWIDSSYEIKNNFFLQTLMPYLASTSVAIYKHPKRKCIYEEFKADLKYNKCSHNMARQ